jgi:hypothetical protein
VIRGRDAGTVKQWYSLLPLRFGQASALEVQDSMRKCTQVNSQVPLRSIGLSPHKKDRWEDVNFMGA